MPSDPEPHPWAGPNETFVSDFAASMPATYRQRFDDAAVRAHAAIVYRRGRRAARVERWATHGGTAAVCVVADDAPGLLSLISASLVVHELDVVAGHVYCRETDEGLREAVDFFWLSRAPQKDLGDVDEVVIACVADVLDALVRGKTTLHGAKRYASALRDRADAAPHVWFEDNGPAGSSVLFVETADRPGLLFAITAALFRQRVQILRSEVRTEEGRASDRFDLTEVDGRPIGRGRQLEVQMEVLAAIETRWKQRVG
jgi:[protein-PII] uridylyltransferase